MLLFLLALLKIAVDGERLVCQWCAEEQTCQIAHHQHDEVAIYAQHVGRLLEVPLLAKVYEQLLLSSSHVEGFGGEHGIGSEQHGGGNANV